jgi:hypothetical protein
VYLSEGWRPERLVVVRFVVGRPLVDGTGAPYLASFFFFAFSLAGRASSKSARFFDEFCICASFS